MDEARLVKFFVLDDDDNEVGRFVLDMSRVIDMYCHKMALQQGTDDFVVGNVTGADTSDDDPIMEQLTPNTAWHKKLSDGSWYLRYKPTE